MRVRVTHPRQLAGAAVVVLALGAPAVAAADPPSVPHVPPIVGTFQVNPDSGPASSTITYKGFCGFPASRVVPAFEGASGVIVFDGVFLKTTPFGQFSVNETVPLVVPGGYFARVVCFDSEENFVELPQQLFEVIVGSPRGGGGPER